MLTVNLRVGESTHRLEVDPQASLLDGLLGNGISVSYSCRRGDCRQCLGSLCGGQVIPLDAGRPFTDAGRLLLCNARAMSDIELTLPYFRDLDGIPVRKSACKVHELIRRSQNVLEVVLRLPKTAPFKALPGQFVRLTNKDRVTRSYSLSGASVAENQLRVQIARVEGGAFTRYVFDDAKAGDLLHLEGPMGQFILQSDVAVKTTVFAATGTGIAPIQAMLRALTPEQQASCGSIHVYWGNRIIQDAYCSAEMRELADARGFQYHEVYSREPRSGELSATRHVQDLIFVHLTDLREAQVFASGNAAMIDQLQARASAAGLPPNRYYADPFTAS